MVTCSLLITNSVLHWRKSIFIAWHHLVHTACFSLHGQLYHPFSHCPSLLAYAFSRLWSPSSSYTLLYRFLYTRPWLFFFFSLSFFPTPAIHPAKDSRQSLKFHSKGQNNVFLPFYIVTRLHLLCEGCACMFTLFNFQNCGFTLQFGYLSNYLTDAPHPLTVDVTKYCIFLLPLLFLLLFSLLNIM